LEPSESRGRDRLLTEEAEGAAQSAERGARNEQRAAQSAQPGTADETSGAQTGAPRSALRAPRSVEAPHLLLEQVSKWYGRVIGVNQITLELRPGITGLVGSNGAGKTTLLRLASGHLRPDLGQVRVCGVDALTPQAKRYVGYCPETDVFYEEMSGRQFV